MIYLLLNISFLPLCLITRLHTSKEMRQSGFKTNCNHQNLNAFLVQAYYAVYIDNNIITNNSLFTVVFPLNLLNASKVLAILLGFFTM